MNNSPIGIFDSGLGGLTVLQSLEIKFPNESFIYFGDTARVPYGNKSAETVINYSKQIGEFLQNHQVKMIVVACNTSSALALEKMKNYFSIPVFGVIEPAVLFAEKISSNSVVVLATRATIKSKAYSKQFRKIESSKNVIEKSCPLFVPIIEEGFVVGKITEDIMAHYLNEFKETNIHQFILGCTHYPILKPALQNYLGNDVQLITSGEALAPILSSFMDINHLFSEVKQTGTVFFVTDFPQKFHEIGSQFFGRNLKNIQHVRNF